MLLGGRPCWIGNEIDREFIEGTRVQFIARALSFTQLRGEHRFARARDFSLNWQVNFAATTRGEPDTLFFELCFALPPKALAVGESSERAIHVLATGDRLAQKGTARTTLAGFAQVEGRECARLVTEVDLAIEPAAPAEGHGRKRVRIVAYFDLRARRFLRIDAAVAIAIRTRARIAHGTGPKLWSVASLDTLLRFSARHGS